MVGQDIYTGTPRFTFGFRELYSGINFVSVAVGVFGVAEILRNLEDEKTRTVLIDRVSEPLAQPRGFPPHRRAGAARHGARLAPRRPAGRRACAGLVRRLFAREARCRAGRRISGRGAIEGVAAPESANNAAAQTSFIPLLTLGLPAHPVMALMVGAFIIQGITPGPNVIHDEPALFWGLIVSMWVGNLMLVLLNLPLIGIWVRMLTIPYNVLFPAIIGFACIGCYSINLNAFHVYAIAFFGIVGYGLVKLGCEPAPLLLGFVLGPLLEEHLRRAMIISHGDPTVFLTRPISAALLAAALVALVLAVLPTIRAKREEVFQEED